MLIACLLLLPAIVDSAIHGDRGSPSSICEYTSACSCRDGKLYCRCDQYEESVRLSGTGHDYLPTTIGTIVIENCTKVMVASLALEKVTPLRSLTLINIGTIYLDEEAFSWGTSKILEQYSDPGIDVRITNSTIVAIPQYAFKGHLNSVILDRVKISTVMALAFSNIAGMEKLEITNCAIEAVEQQAFKKFIVGNLKFSGGSIEVMPSYSLTGITVKGSLVMEDMHIGYVRSSAIKVEGPRVFELSNCVIDHLEGDAFRVTTTGPVYINHNSLPDLAYGVFGGISVDPRYVAVAQRQELFFENNTLYRFSDSALLFNTSGLKPKLSHIMIDRPCSCNEFQYWTSKLVKFTTPPNPLRLERAIWCSKGHGLSALVEDEERKNCLTSSVHTTLIMFVILMTLISLMLVCSVGLYFYRRHTKKYMNVPTNDGANNRLSVLSTNSNHIIVIPEGRVYRETELHVVEEHLTPIPPTTVSQHV